MAFVAVRMRNYQTCMVPGEMVAEVEISEGSRLFPLEKKSSRLKGLRSIWSATSIVSGKATSIKVENFQRDEEGNNRN